MPGKSTRQLTAYFDQVHLHDGLSGGFHVYGAGWRERSMIVKKWIADHKPSSILDVGCGTGIFINQSVDEVVDLLCLEDIVEGKVRQAVELNRDKAISVQGRVSDIFEMSDSRQFDVVIMIGVTDYYQDWRTMLMTAMSRSRGGLIVDFPKKFTARMVARRVWLFMHGIKVYSIERVALERFLGDLFPGHSRVICETTHNWMVMLSGGYRKSNSA